MLFIIKCRHGFTNKKKFNKKPHKTKKSNKQVLKKIPNLGDHFKDSIDQPYLNQFVF